MSELTAALAATAPPSTSVMIEKVARAILMAGEKDDIFWDSFFPEEVCSMLARAAIAAMINPTDEMRAKGGEIYDGSGYYLGSSRATICWQVMIDEALK